MADQAGTGDRVAGAAVETARLDEAACRTLAESTSDLVLRLDGSGRIVGLNAAARAALGAPNSLADALPAAAREVEAAVQRLAVGAAAAPFFATQSTSGAAETRLEGSLLAVDRGGACVGALAVLRDVTEQARLAAELAELKETTRRLERLNAVKSNFVSLVSHEFRTPLTGIVGFSEMMRDEDLSVEEMREYAADINKDAQRLSRMIEEMLDYDRMESGQMTLNLEAVRINAVLDDVAEQCRTTAPNHSIVLRLDRALGTLRGDPDKVIQVATNLLSNAVKYAPDGGVILLTSHLEDAAAHIEIQDHGLGIPPEALERVFDRFTRVESGSTRYIRGTGLGLPIVRQIVGLHGGRVWAESAVGQGSTFHVVLPLSGPSPRA